MNIVLAWILISIGLMFGSYQSLTDQSVLSKNVKTSEERVRVFQISENSPAAEAGLKMSDAILKVNGVSVASESDVQNFINESGDEAVVTIERLGETKELVIKPEFNEELNRKTIGIAISYTAFIKYPWYLALVEGVKVTGQFLWLIIYTFFDFLKGLVVGQPVSVEVAGPVGIANLTGQMARMGFIYLIQFTALLSLNLAVINFLPFPALDGGRLVFLLIEKIKGSPVKQEVEAVFHNVGFLLLMLLIVWVTFKDIVGLFN
jgi:regulator of sigma E protease